MRNKRLGGCWCSLCRFKNRSSWWKNVLKERDIKKEFKNAIIAREKEHRP